MILKSNSASAGCGQKNPRVVAVTTLAAVVSGLSGMFFGFFDDGDGAGSAVSAWRATAEDFYLPAAAERVVPMAEGWRFRTGDDLAWSGAGLDDSDWAEIEVDQSWEDEGFAGYDGLAWYRCRFAVPTVLPDGTVYLRLGRIDDSDQVWLNGEYIGGRGSMAAGGSAAWDVERHYEVPRGLLRLGEQNVLAVRVWDERLEGGLVDGTPALMVQSLPAPLIDLQGEWSLSRDDRAEYRTSLPGEDAGTAVVVPGNWEDQGRAGFDGVLWYQIPFATPAVVGEREDLVLVLGVIDDTDETYLNGELIGTTTAESGVEEVWNHRRVYPFSSALLRSDGSRNLLAVRVQDEHGRGGIVHGPVGIMRATDWARYVAERDQANDSWSRVWNWLLGRS